MADTGARQLETSGRQKRFQRLLTLNMVGRAVTILVLEVVAARLSWEASEVMYINCTAVTAFFLISLEWHRTVDKIIDLRTVERMSTYLWLTNGPLVYTHIYAHIHHHLASPMPSSISLVDNVMR